MATLQSHTFAVPFVISNYVMSIIIKKDVNGGGGGGLPFKFADFLRLFNFEWHNQNELGNIGILVLWRDREKLYFSEAKWLTLNSCFIFFRIESRSKIFRTTITKVKVIGQVLKLCH